MSEKRPQPPNSDRSDGESAGPASVLFYHRHQRVFATVLDTRLEVGRQRSGEPAPSRRLERAQGARVILAPLDDLEVSRSHIALTPLPAADNKGTAGGNLQVEIKNLSRTLPVRVSPNTNVAPGKSVVAEVPLLVQFSAYAVRVEPPEEEELELQALPERTIPPSRELVEGGLGRLNIDTMDEQLLLRWLETLLGVFQSTANSRDFPMLAAKALVKIVGLDAAAMLQCDGEGRWQVEAWHSVDPTQNEQTWVPSQTLLGSVLKERRTFRHVPANVSDKAHSLQNVSALVAAPILDGEGNVIGALYGDRRSGGSVADDLPDISMFEAKLVEVLASGIAAGIARVKEEQAALAARIQFQQFFTPQLALQLEKDPQLLEGRDAEITLLFADIRGFSRISERVGAARTMDWIQDTMGTLSECVLACDGVLVDFLGDELMAMWGAPVSQADHAVLACHAAEQMLRALPEINSRWQKELGAPMRLGIGLNSGVTRVGNTGSRQKFKYGPLGDTVNVASRVQGATKYLGADCLITGTTLSLLSPDLATRRLARVRVVNIDQAIELHELVSSPPADWQLRSDRFQAALVALEKRDMGAAAKLARKLTVDFPDDSAAAALAHRVAQAEQSPEPGDTSIWCLPGK